MRAPCWWQDSKGFIREGTLTTEHEAVDVLPILIADDGIVLGPDDVGGVELHVHGTTKDIVFLRGAARSAGYRIMGEPGEGRGKGGA